MGERDHAEKELEMYEDVFADIVNVLLFNGEEIIEPEKLTDAEPRSQYSGDGEMHEQERDVIDRFHSDFKYVADYFWQMRTQGTYRGSKEKLRHAKAVM